MLGFLDGVAMDITKLIVLGSALQDTQGLGGAAVQDAGRSRRCSSTICELSRGQRLPEQIQGSAGATRPGCSCKKSLCHSLVECLLHDILLLPYSFWLKAALLQTALLLVCSLGMAARRYAYDGELYTEDEFNAWYRDRA